MKTIYVLNERQEKVKRYLTNDGTIFEEREIAMQNEKRVKLISSIKEKFNSVFTNGDDVANSLLEGLQLMLECDRRAVIKGLNALTTTRKNKKKDA